MLMFTRRNERRKGTLGKLVTNDSLYVNLTNASKELEELLREMKLNPKRFVHFSLFGKKAKGYNAENNKNNVSNKKIMSWIEVISYKESTGKLNVFTIK